MLRLTNADVLPFEFLSLADSIGRYVTEISKLADDMRQQTAEKNRQIQEGTLEAYFDLQKPHVLPTPKPEVPAVTFKALQDAVAKLQASSERFAEQVNRLGLAGHPLSPSAEETLDRILFGSARANRARGANDRRLEPRNRPCYGGRQEQPSALKEFPAAADVRRRDSVTGDA